MRQRTFLGNCHCRDCQKSTGGAYVPAFAVLAQAVKIAGEVKILREPSRQREYIQPGLKIGGIEGDAFDPWSGIQLALEQCD